MMPATGSYDDFLARQQQQSSSSFNYGPRPPQSTTSETYSGSSPRGGAYSGDAQSIRDPPGAAQRFFTTVAMTYRQFLDAVASQITVRWVLAGCLLFYYVLMRTIHGGFHLVSYGLFLTCLLLFIEFLTPKHDPADNAESDDGAALPRDAHDEYRPFMRRLPEFNFWLAVCKAAVVANFCSLLPFLDIPVFWPLLVAYCIVVSYLLFKQRVDHMLKYKYVPFSMAKPTYDSKSSYLGKSVGIYTQ